MKGKKSFTLAEVLITLAIIGIVSALTIPSVVKNYQKHQTEVRLKKIYTTISNALVQSQAINGNISTWNWSLSRTDFFNKYLMPHLNIVQTCGTSYNDTKCLVSRTKFFNGHAQNNADMWNAYRRAYLLKDGAAIFWDTYGNSNANDGQTLSIYIDLDGKSGKNTMGYDTFIFFILRPDNYNKIINRIGYGDGYIARFLKGEGKETLYPDGYGYPLSTLLSSSNYRGCNKQSSFSGMQCGAVIMLNNWKIPKNYPW